MLSVIIVSWNHGTWLPACVSSVLAQAGGITIEIIVVDSGSHDGTAEIADSLGARLVACENHGFAYANNRGLEHVTGEWVLFLNPDTRIVEGTLRDLVSVAASHPRLAIAGVRQLGAEGTLEWSIRRSPSPIRWLSEALGSESLPWRRRSWAGERVLDSSWYTREGQLDWTSGSCMLARTEVVHRIGGMDERFFLYSEEPDLSLRARKLGWETWHLPTLTIVHYGGNQGSDPRLTAQLAHARRLYLGKHGSPVERLTGFVALVLGNALRGVVSRSAQKRACARAALATLVGVRPPPFAAQTARRSSDEMDSAPT
jgi:GT2 family glycosyltransferase